MPAGIALYGHSEQLNPPKLKTGTARSMAWRQSAPFLSHLERSILYYIMIYHII